MKLGDKQVKWLSKIFKSNRLQEQKTLLDSVNRWNSFISEICFKDQSKLTLIQKAAVLSFWYYTEMHSGGHSGYFDCYPGVNSEDLIWALCEVGGSAYVDNYKEAVINGHDDGYLKTDNIFYSTVPSLSNILMEYVEVHYEDILEK